MDRCPICDLPHPATNPYCFCQPMIVGMDLSDGVETHCEGFIENGVLTITDMYHIIDHKKSPPTTQG